MWCYANEISLATVIGSTGHMLGIGVGYLVPIFIVDHSETHQNDVTNSTLDINSVPDRKLQLTFLYAFTSSISLLVLIVMAFLFQRDPSTQPTIAERRRSIHIERRKSSALEKLILTSVNGENWAEISLARIQASKMQRFIMEMKVFWQEIRSICSNQNWRKLLASFFLINGCIEAFQIEAVFMIRKVLSGTYDEVNLKVSIILASLWTSKLLSSWIAGFMADRFHNFKKLGLGAGLENCFPLYLDHRKTAYDMRRMICRISYATHHIADNFIPEK